MDAGCCTLRYDVTVTCDCLQYRNAVVSIRVLRMPHARSSCHLEPAPAPSQRFRFGFINNGNGGVCLWHGSKLRGGGLSCVFGSDGTDGSLELVVRHVQGAHVCIAVALCHLDPCRSC